MPLSICFRRTGLSVAAYARVSTDQEEQETSFEAQCDYYSKLIRGNPAWEYAGLYTDDGVSATSTARREGFNRLIADALDGKIDRIITKSVSRFARNTVDSLTTIRRLKEKGVGVTFEKENIDTLDSKGELMITIMSSLAQEESRSISENVTWGWRKAHRGRQGFDDLRELPRLRARRRRKPGHRRSAGPESCGRSMGCFWTDRPRRASRPR